MLNQIVENHEIENLAKIFARAPFQRNSLHHSDAELIKLPGTKMTLAITMDSIVEEIETGLYSDPYLLGWMAVMASASDLAAVGARPLGILINETFLTDTKKSFKIKIQNGIEAACYHCGMYVLGGDTNISSQMEITGCALGYIDKADPVTRKGCKPGDLLFISGKMGIGNAFALKKLTDSLDKDDIVYYQPKSRLPEGQIISDFATCCMDSSDGFFAALDQLKRINGAGFILESKSEDFIHPDALRCCQSRNLPDWLMLAGHHGEYELLFTIPEKQLDAFSEAAKEINWQPVRIGKVHEQTYISMNDKMETVEVNTGRIRNIFSENSDKNVEEYIKKLLDLGKTFNRRAS